ncbi:hypothetical protein QUF72_01410 [Desulfobacterales bacterium HSG2]|nr:hypothetical protein [Desulfobacterales bacterium HSG2]
MKIGCPFSDSGLGTVGYKIAEKGDSIQFRRIWDIIPDAAVVSRVSGYPDTFSRQNRENWLSLY